MKGLEKGGARHQSLRDAARIELAMRAFLVDGDFQGYTDTFENLTGLKQLPGIASQRLMADGYGFGAEGDWKHAALVRSMKVMAHGLKGGTSFMEDYTYHFDPSGPAVLGAHMLEICPSIARGKPSCEVHPLGIGGKEDPVRLVFDSQTGAAVNASIVDMGNRFRMIVNTVKVVPPHEKLPKLPVARALWEPQPSLGGRRRRLDPCRRRPPHRLLAGVERPSTSKISRPWRRRNICSSTAKRSFATSGTSCAGTTPPTWSAARCAEPLANRLPRRRRGPTILRGVVRLLRVPFRGVNGTGLALVRTKGPDRPRSDPRGRRDRHRHRAPPDSRRHRLERRRRSASGKA